MPFVKKLAQLHLLTAVALFGLPVMQGVAQDLQLQSKHAPREDGDLQLSITATKSEFIVGEDIKLKLLLKNASTDPFWFRYTFEVDHGEYNGFVLRATDEHGRDIPLGTWELPRKRSRAGYILQPGQVLNDCLVANRLADLSQPGTYRLRVIWTYHASERKIASNTLTVNVISKP